LLTDDDQRLKRCSQLLYEDHGQATQNPTLDRCVAIFILEKLNNDPKHCPSLALQAKTAREQFQSYMVKTSFKECQSLKLPQHLQSQNGRGALGFDRASGCST
jgi:hypothetical protein